MRAAHSQSTRPTPISRKVLSLTVDEAAAGAAVDSSPSRAPALLPVTQQGPTQHRRVTSYMNAAERKKLISQARTSHHVLTDSISASIELLGDSRLSDVKVSIKFPPQGGSRIEDIQAIELALRWKVDGSKTRLSFDRSFIKKVEGNEFEFLLDSVARVTLRSRMPAPLPTQVERDFDAVTDLAHAHFLSQRQVLDMRPQVAPFSMYARA